MGGGEGEGLARPGDALDQVDAGAARAHPPHHRRLLVGDRRSGVERLVDGDRVGDAGSVVLAAGGRGEEPLLDGDHLGGAVAVDVLAGGDEVAVAAVERCVAVLAEGDDVVRREEGVGQLEDVVDAAAGGERVADGLDHVPASEHRGHGGQPVRARHPGEELVGLDAAGDRNGSGPSPVEGVGQRVGVEAEDLGLVPPPGDETGGADVVGLGGPGEVDGVLGGLGAGEPVLGEVGFDLGAAGGEGVDEWAGDAGDVGEAVLDRVPLDAEAAGELVAQLGVVEVPDGAAPLVERPAVEGGPAVVLGGVDEVGDHDVGVQVRVEVARRPVPEGGADEPVALDGAVAAGAPPSLGDRLVDLERPGDGDVVGVADLVGDLGVAESEQQGHGFRGAEGGVEPDDLRHRVATGESLAGGRVLEVEDPVELVGVDLARQPEAIGAGADPLAGRLAGAGVVVLDAVGDGAEVVLGPTRGASRCSARPDRPADSPTGRPAQHGRCKCV